MVTLAKQGVVAISTIIRCTVKNLRYGKGTAIVNEEHKFKAAGNDEEKVFRNAETVDEDKLNKDNPNKTQPFAYERNQTDSIEPWNE